ncbi:MAG: 50S ribosomal protein L25 [Dehalococcoidales bacterium]|nr:50S ribosomal protein L25 [Dehalococcoidales bacterium]
MEGIALKATTRDTSGKKTRFLRREGITPTHLFGHNLKSLTLQCNTNELKQVIAQVGTTTLFNLGIDGEKRTRKVLIREIQTDPLGRQILHVDFYQIKMTEKLKVEIPLVLSGEAPAMKIKGRSLQHPLNVLNIECLPDKLPHEIEVDLSLLTELGQSIHVKDLRLSADITVSNDPEQLIVKVIETAAARAEEEEEEEVTAAGETAPTEAGAEENTEE